MQTAEVHQLLAYCGGRITLGAYTAVHWACTRMNTRNLVDVMNVLADDMVFYSAHGDLERYGYAKQAFDTVGVFLNEHNGFEEKK